MEERPAPLLIYYIYCQNPAWGQLNLALLPDTLLHMPPKSPQHSTAPSIRPSVCVCVIWGSDYEPTERQPIGLSRLPAPNNGGVKGRKEGERSVVCGVSLCPAPWAGGQNAGRRSDLFCLTIITKVVGGFAVCLLSHYEFSQSAKVVCVCFPVCVPVFSSVSLDLLPERTATLMVYEEVVEIVSGIQGEKTIPVFSFTHSEYLTFPCTVKNKHRFKFRIVISHMISSSFSLSGPANCILNSWIEKT